MIDKKECAYYEESWVADPAKDCRKIDCDTCPCNDGYLK